MHAPQHRRAQGEGHHLQHQPGRQDEPPSEQEQQAHQGVEAELHRQGPIGSVHPAQIHRRHQRLHQVRVDEQDAEHERQGIGLPFIGTEDPQGDGGDAGAQHQRRQQPGDALAEEVQEAVAPLQGQQDDEPGHHEEQLDRQPAVLEHQVAGEGRAIGIIDRLRPRRGPAHPIVEADH